MNPCWMFKRQTPLCFVHLGKFGDIAIMLPAFHQIFKETGVRPICIVSSQFASIFDGVSYVEPWVHDLHWFKGIPQARKIAEQKGLKPIIIKWWDEPGGKPPFDVNGKRSITLKVHNRLVSVPESEWDSYQASQWRHAGFTMEQMIQWPLVFDRRDLSRESILRARVFKTPLPKILVSLPGGGTSPFKQRAQATMILRRPDVEIVDLANIRAERIYDLLGLYDKASGLITSDTSTLHLAAASDVPYIALVNNGGSGSIPRGNCILKIRYADFTHRIADYLKAFDTMKSGNAHA